MKIRISDERGSVLIICVMITGILGVILAAYLKLAAFQNQTTARSHSWNAALPLAEAGVEEALAHLYHTGGANLATNGWIAANQEFTRVRSNDFLRIWMSISNVSPPVIYSRGDARIPGQSDGYVSRLVRVETSRESLFSKAIVARNEIVFNGNNITVDSFDSANPAYSTGGLYDPAKRRSNGDVATNLDVVNALDTGNANIFGKVSTGPGGTVEIGPNGKVGDLAWQSSPSSSGIAPGWSSDDMNVLFPEVKLPYAGGFAPPVISGDYVIQTSGDYLIQDLNKSLIVNSNVQARLIVNHEIDIGGTDKITLEPGAALTLYMDGESAKIRGNGVVNQNSAADSFVYRGTPRNKNLTISGNGSFTGVIYAPDAEFVMNGGGSGVEDVVGASVTGTTTMNGKFQFHYDENLGRRFKERPFVVTGWSEL